MPLPNVVNGTALRCRAKCKATGERCRNLAAWGCKSCRYHGARKGTLRESAHWNYQHGNETLVAKAERSARLAELRDLEALSFGLGFATGQKWRGRKPRLGK